MNEQPADVERLQPMTVKTLVSQLAISGADPAFCNMLHVGRPNIGDRHQLWLRINDLLDRRSLTNHGQYVQEFEQEIAARVGVRHCIAVCNGTVALEILIRALGLRGEVVVPSFTFAATAHALMWQGITPVFCDVDRSDHTIDVRRVEERITPRTTGILAVHLWGNACNVDELAEIAERRKLKLVFDAAHAFGCSYKGRMIGNCGHAEVFSFHATKFINAFEGGAIVTNDDDLAARMRLMRNLGFRGFDDVVCVGTNGKMSEVSAAMGLTNLESMDNFVAINHRHYQQYRSELIDIPGIKLLSLSEVERCNYQYIVVEVDEGRAGLSRNDLVRVLHAENVRARRYFFPGCHRMPPYRGLDPEAGTWLPETERLTECVMCLPTGSTLRSEDVAAICQIVRLAVVHAAELRTVLSVASQFEISEPPLEIGTSSEQRTVVRT
jgi:dTDP-4-amino-4,6-dideoxygalactose transaminase